MEFSVENNEVNIGDEIIDFNCEFPLHEFLSEHTETAEYDSTIPLQALSEFGLEEKTIETQRNELGLNYLTNNDDIIVSTGGYIYADKCPVSSTRAPEETTSKIWRFERKMDFKMLETNSSLPMCVPSTYEGDYMLWEPIEHENGYNFGSEVNKIDFMNMKNVFSGETPGHSLSSSTQKEDFLQNKPEVDRLPRYVGLPCSYPGCGKVFRNNSSLKKHKRIHGPRMHKCGECGKAFLDNPKLKRHQLSHTREKPVPCKFPGCEKRFSLAYNMRIHMLLHTGERPHLCPMKGCNRSFVQASHLKVHLKKHSQMLSEN